jgi:hypothetical protein
MQQPPSDIVTVWASTFERPAVIRIERSTA